MALSSGLARQAALRNIASHRFYLRAVEAKQLQFLCQHRRGDSPGAPAFLFGAERWIWPPVPAYEKIPLVKSQGWKLSDPLQTDVGILSRFGGA
jgi:hypothetical protein